MASLTFLLVVAASLNLRTVLSVVGGTSSTMGDLLGLSNAVLGSISTVSIIGLALGALLARTVIPKFGLYRTSVFALAGTVCAFALLTFESSVAIMASVALSGLLSGVMGTALPTVVRLALPPRSHGVGIACMMAGTSIGTAIAGFLTGWSVEFHSHWRPAVLVLLGVGLVALALWSLPTSVKTLLITQGYSPVTNARPGSTKQPRGLPHWLIFLTIFLTLQSTIVFAQIAWLVPTVTSWGGALTTATMLLSVLTGAQIIGGFIAPILSSRIGSENTLLFASVLMVFLGTSGIAFFGAQASSTLGVQVSTLLLACGHGSTFAMANLLLTTRSVDHLDTARNTSFCMLVSQLIAAVGPFYFSVVSSHFGFTVAWNSTIFIAGAFVLSSIFLVQALSRQGGSSVPSSSSVPSDDLCAEPELESDQHCGNHDYPL